MKSSQWRVSARLVVWVLMSSGKLIVLASVDSGVISFLVGRLKVLHFACYIVTLLIGAGALLADN